MTSLTLLLWITSAILLQLAIYLGVIYWKHFTRYQALADDVVSPPAISAREADVVAWSGWRTFKVTRKFFEDEARSVCSFYLVPADGKPLPSYSPGQFLTFQVALPDATGVSEQVVRCYSLSDMPRAEGYRVSIKRAPAPGRASHYFHDQVEVGHLLQVRAPSGHFYLERGDEPVVLIGGGIGITPMLSMLNWSLTHQPEREVWLFYSVHNVREWVMKAQLESLALAHPNFHLWLCISHPQSQDVAGRDYRHHGRVDIALLRAQLALKPYQFYICGPTAMLESLVPALEDWGVVQERIHFEAFGPASIKRAAKPATATHSANQTVVNFALSEKKLSWDAASNSLLEFAEANGVSINSGCRSGCCGSCQTKLRAGEVSYRQPPEFDLETGTCLPCVCTPKTNVTLEL